jgi:hypothetical protein
MRYFKVLYHYELYATYEANLIYFLNFMIADLLDDDFSNITY